MNEQTAAAAGAATEADGSAMGDDAEDSTMSERTAAVAGVATEPEGFAGKDDAAQGSAGKDDAADELTLTKFMNSEDIWMYAGWLPILATLHPVETTIPRKSKKPTEQREESVATVTKSPYAKYDMMWRTPRLNHNVPKTDKMCQIINNALKKPAGEIKEEGGAHHWAKLDNDSMNIVGYKQVRHRHTCYNFDEAFITDILCHVIRPTKKEER